MRLLAQAHRAGQTCATLEGMQRPHAGIGPSCIAGAQQPFAQCTVQLRQQLARLFFEDREQLGLDLIGQTGFDLVRICAGRGRGQGLKGQLVQTRQQAVRPAERIHIGFVLVQRLQQLGIVSLQEAGGELVQQMAHMVARLHKQRHLGLAETAGTLRPGERVLQRPRQGGQIFVTHRRGIAGQCMRQGFGTARQRPSQLDGPFGQAGAQAARQLVGFIQEDIEQRDADAQRANQLDAVLRRFRRLLAHSFGSLVPLVGPHGRRHQFEQSRRRRIIFNRSFSRSFRRGFGLGFGLKFGFKRRHGGGQRGHGVSRHQRWQLR